MHILNLIQAYSELWIIQTRNVSRIFRHILHTGTCHYAIFYAKYKIFKPGTKSVLIV